MGMRVLHERLEAGNNDEDSNLWLILVNTQPSAFYEGVRRTCLLLPHCQ